MCGRYTLIHGLGELKDRFGFRGEGLDLLPRYNLAPGQEAPVIVSDGGRRVVRMMRWGLVPVWAKDEKIGNRMINARSETLAEKPAFRRLLTKRRCLVLADGFFEWRTIPGRKGKYPIRLVLNGEGPFAFAGLWDAWKSPEGGTLESFTIITTAANKLIQPIHERMPVILKKKDEELWLDPDVDDADALSALLKAYPDREMKYYDVSRAVNNPRNDSPACITPRKPDDEEE